MEALRDVCGQVLRVAGEAGLVKWGTVATDGTKMQGNASRHKAISDGSRRKEADRVREDVEALVTQAHQHDAEDDAVWAAGGAMNCPPSWRAVQTAWPPRGGHAPSGSAGGSRGGRRAPAAGRGGGGTSAPGDPASRQSARTSRRDPDDKAQTNLTETALQSMRTTNKGWEYCGNAQASVDAAHQIIVACDVAAESNDKQQAAPMAQLTVASLEQAGIVPPRMPLAPRRKCHL